MSAPDRYETLLESSRNFMKDRPTMRDANHSSLPALLGLLFDEVKEAIETVDSGDAIIEEKYVAIEQELADIGLFLLTAFDILGSDPFKAMMEKHARNMLKYPANLFQEGDFQSSLASAKKMWRDSGGNHDFYNGHSKYIIDVEGNQEAMRARSEAEDAERQKEIDIATKRWEAQQAQLEVVNE